MTTSELGIALLGQKFMGKAHSNAWSQVGHFFDLPIRPRLETIAARNEESLKEFAAKWGWQSHTTDWKSIAKNDAVQLVT